MAIWGVPVDLLLASLDTLIDVQNGPKGRDMEIGTHNKEEGHHKRHCEIPVEDHKLFSPVLEIGHNSVPVIIDVESRCDQEQEGQINVNARPLIFGESPQAPIRPVSHSSVWHDI